MKKRLLGLLFVLAMAMTLLPAGVSSADSAENEVQTLIEADPASEQTAGVSLLALGDEESTLSITTAEQLLDFAAQVNGTGNYAGKANNFADRTVKLTADIDLSGVCGADVGGGTDWTSIGTDGHKFEGIFDGNGHSVSNIYINNSSYYQGLFGCIDGGTVKNVGVVDVNISAQNYVGGVVGYAWGNGATVQNCYITGAVNGGDSAYVGGVVGCANTGTVQNCYSTGVLNGGNSAYVGGVVGYVSDNATVQNCYSTGSVNGGNYAKTGGLVGVVYFGTVQNCYSTGAVSVDGICATVGGVVGYVYGGTVQNNVALNPSVSVSGSVDSYIGAVVGDNYSSTISGSYYWGGMSVKIANIEQTKDSYGSIPLIVQDDLLYSAAGALDWSAHGFDSENGWTIPTNTPELPCFANSSYRPALPLAYTQQTVSVLDEITAANGHVTLLCQNLPAQVDAIYYAAYDSSSKRMISVYEVEMSNSAATLQLIGEADNYKVLFLNKETLKPMLAALTFDSSLQ